MTARRGQPRRAAVLGSPIAHSLSPLLHRAAYDAVGLSDWRYDAIECDEAGLRDFVDRAGPEWVGLSLTLPLKRAALTVADEVSGLAESVGAANTLLLHEGRHRAENTDVAGIADALGEAGVRAASSAVVLGAGGTARAALAALSRLGVSEPVVVVRDMSRTAELRATASRLGITIRFVADFPACGIPCTEVLVSAVPPHAADAARFEKNGRPDVVLDVVYAPWPTALTATALDRGATVVGGRAVLLHQAVAQVELMTGQPAPVEAMRSALEGAGAAPGVSAPG